MQRTRDAHDILNDLQGLNRRFLHLARTGLPGPAATGPDVLSRLDHRAMERLASLPFALFSFGFGAEGTWERLQARGVRDAEPPAAADPGQERFALLALAYLRQLARTHPRRAAALAGVAEPVGRWLASLDLGALAILAPQAAELLRWRFPGQERLWAALMDSCREPDGSQLPVLRATALQWTIRRALDLRLAGPRASRAFRDGPG